MEEKNKNDEHKQKELTDEQVRKLIRRISTAAERNTWTKNHS